MMNRLSKVFGYSFFMFASLPAFASSGPYVGEIKTLSITDIGDPYNTVFLTIDITDSSCSSTNQYNRFTITNNAQLSLLLTAASSGKPVTITGSGTCNNANIEDVVNVRLSP